MHLGIRTHDIYSILMPLLYCFLKYNHILKAGLKRCLHSFGWMLSLSFCSFMCSNTSAPWAETGCCTSARPGSGTSSYQALGTSWFKMSVPKMVAAEETSTNVSAKSGYLSLLKTPQHTLGCWAVPGHHAGLLQVALFGEREPDPGKLSDKKSPRRNFLDFCSQMVSSSCSSATE